MAPFTSVLYATAKNSKKRNMTRFLVAGIRSNMVFSVRHVRCNPILMASTSASSGGNLHRTTLQSISVRHQSSASSSSSTTSNLQKEIQHEKMKHVLHNSSIPPGSGLGLMEAIKVDPERHARFRQSLWNLAGSFLLFVMAAQSLKSGALRRKSEAELEKVRSQLQEVQTACQMVLENDAGDAVVSRIVHDVMTYMSTVSDSNETAAPLSSIWKRFTVQPSPDNSDTDLSSPFNKKEHKQHIEKLVRGHLFAALAPTAYADDQRKLLEIRSLAEAKHDADALMQDELVQVLLAEQEKSSAHTDADGATVVRKPLFHI
jgi:hypothetical protein